MLQKVTSLSKQSAVYGLGTFLNQGLAFFLIPLYTRFLSPDEYGINTSVTALMGVLSLLLTLSLDSAVSRFYYDMDTEEQRKKYFGTAWIFLIGFGLLVAVLLEAVGVPLFALVFGDVPYAPYGRLAVWSTYVGVASVIPTVIFRVREQPQTFIAFSVSQFLLRILLNLLFVVHLGQGVTGVFVATLIANLIYAVPYTWITIRNLRFAFDPRQLRESLTFSLPLLPQRLSGWVLNVSDRIVAGFFVSLGALGLYGVGYRFGMMLASVLDAINLAWAPFYFKTAKEEGGRQALARLSTYYLFAVTFLTLGTVLLSREVLFLIADPKYHAAYRVVPPVALAYGLHGIYLMAVSGISYAKKTARLPIYVGAAAALNVAVNVWLIPKFGIMVAAWSTLLAFLVRAVLVGLDSLRAFPLPYEWKRLGAALALGLGLCAGWFIELGDLWLNLAAKAALVCAYPVLIAVTMLRPDERNGLRIVRRRLRARLIRFLGQSDV